MWDEDHGVVDIFNLTVEDLVKLLSVLDVGGLAFYSSFITHCVCQALGICCLRHGPMANEALKLTNASGKQGRFGGMSGQVV